VWITEVIAAEACDQGWLRVVKLERAGSAVWSPLNPGVDAGEASAIALALQQRDAGHDVLLLALRDQGYYLSDSLIAAVLQQCGESAG